MAKVQVCSVQMKHKYFYLELKPRINKYHLKLPQLCNAAGTGAQVFLVQEKHTSLLGSIVNSHEPTNQEVCLKRRKNDKLLS